jgi:hypothetical protein
MSAECQIAAISLLTLVLMMHGYFVVCVSTPFDLTRHIETSLCRLLTQLYLPEHDSASRHGQLLWH